VRKVRDWMSSGRCRILSPYLFQPSSLTLNQKEEVKQEDEETKKRLTLESSLDIGVANAAVPVRPHNGHLSMLHKYIQSVCKIRSWRRVPTLQNTLGYAVVMVQTIVKASLFVWDRLVDADGFLALPAKALCGVILAVIVYHPVAIWFAIMGKPAPLCYILYFLFLFYVSTLLIVGLVIGYLREGG